MEGNKLVNLGDGMWDVGPPIVQVALLRAIFGTGDLRGDWVVTAGAGQQNFGGDNGTGQVLRGACTGAPELHTGGRLHRPSAHQGDHTFHYFSFPLF